MYVTAHDTMDHVAMVVDKEDEVRVVSNVEDDADVVHNQLLGYGLTPVHDDVVHALFAYSTNDDDVLQSRPFIEFQ